jgi:RNA polymerase sigma factor (sigma-70 family)
MSASGPAHDDPGEREPLEELFGSVIGLAGQIASRISRDRVEARLRRTLGEAGYRQEAVPAGETTRPGPAPKLLRDDPVVVVLVGRAAGVDPDAWHELVEFYTPLVWRICARYRLSDPEKRYVARVVWLLLAEQIGKLREPAMLGGWLATTAARECLRMRRTRGSERLDTNLADSPQSADDAMIDEEIILAEQDALLRAAFAELPPRCQQLLSMLLSDPPCSYEEIHAVLGIPLGSIGPERARCLDRLRKSVASYALNEGSQESGRDRLGASFLPVIGMADPEGPARELSSRATSSIYVPTSVAGCCDEMAVPAPGGLLAAQHGEPPAAGSDDRETPAVLYHGSCVAAPAW